MQGFITDSELTQADQEFPGIEDFFAALPIKPRTFLELLARFEHWCEHGYGAGGSNTGASSASGANSAGG